jgi:hypothetical protein
LGVIDELQNAVTALEPLVDLSNYVIVDYNTINGLVGPHVIFYDTNVHVQNGFGGTESSNGLGNLVIGYNEVGSADILNRDGSHYLLVGTGHEYTAFGGIVIGAGNRSHNTYASVTGGASNTASGDYSSVSGGYSNAASGQASSVSGGEWNTASGGGSSIAAGLSNTASGGVSSVSGGYQNSADHFGATISGGQNLNTTSNYQHLPSP